MPDHIRNEHDDTLPRDASRETRNRNINTVRAVIASYPANHPVHAVMRRHVGNNCRRRGAAARFSTTASGRSFMGPVVLTAAALTPTVANGMSTDNYYEEVQGFELPELFFMAVALVCLVEVLRLCPGICAAGQNLSRELVAALHYCSRTVA